MKDLSSKSAQLIIKAQQAFDMRNYPYAAMLFQAVLVAHPEYHPARLQFHLALLRNEEISPKPWMAQIKDWLQMLPSFLVASAQMRKSDWMGAIEAWEICLRNMPRSKSLHRKNAHCLEQLGWTEAALGEYQLLREIAPADTTVLHELARLHCQQNQWDEARQAYEFILKIRPDDAKAPAELRKIAAIHTIEKGGWEDLQSYRSKIRDESQARLLEEQGHLFGSKDQIDAMLATLKAKLQAQPPTAQDPAILREMARLYQLRGDPQSAKEALEQALRLAPHDFSLAQDLQTMQLDQLGKEIARVSAEIATGPADPSKTQALDVLSKEYRLALLKDKKAQVDQYPTNLLLRFELGQLHLEQNNVDEAIAQFQQAVKNPSKRLQAQKYLGECFKRKQLYPLAIEQLQAAAEAIANMSTLKKEILYELASVYERMGKAPEAKREYEKIYTVDIAFKDVAQKILPP